MSFVFQISISSLKKKTLFFCILNNWKSLFWISFFFFFWILILNILNRKITFFFKLFFHFSNWFLFEEFLYGLYFFYFLNGNVFFSIINQDIFLFSCSSSSTKNFSNNFPFSSIFSLFAKLWFWFFGKFLAIILESLSFHIINM